MIPYRAMLCAPAALLFRTKIKQFSRDLRRLPRHRLLVRHRTVDVLPEQAPALERAQSEGVRTGS